MAETLTFNTLTGNWIKETTGTITNTGTVFTGTSDGGGPGGNPGGNPSDTPSLSWRNWILLNETIIEWDPYKLGSIGTKVTTDNTNGQKWGINFKITFDMSIIDSTAYPLKYVGIRLCRVLKDSNGKLAEIKDTDGKIWSATNFPGLKQKDADLPEGHYLSGKLTKDQGTYETICDWYIPEDDDYYTGIMDYSQKSSLQTYWTLTKDKGLKSLKKELNYFLSWDLNIGTKKPTTYYKQNYVLETNQHYFLMVLPLYPTFQGRYEATNYVSFNENAGRFRKGEVVGINWTSTNIIDSANYETEPPTSRKVQFPQIQFKPNEPIDGQIYESTIAWFKTPDKVYTGTMIKGIGTMHKSNAVPIFRQQDAEDLSKMRR